MTQLIKVTPNAFVNKKDIVHVSCVNSYINHDRCNLFFTLSGGERFEIDLAKSEKKFVADLFESHKESAVFDLYDLIIKNRKKISEEDDIQEKRLLNLFREIDSQNRKS